MCLLLEKSHVLSFLLTHQDRTRDQKASEYKRNVGTGGDLFCQDKQRDLQAGACRLEDTHSRDGG